MIKRFLIFLALAALLFPLISCSKKEEPKVEPVKKAAPAQPSKVTGPAISIAAPVESTAEVKQRNPFQSYILLAKIEGAKKVKGPLECCELSMFKLQAVVLGQENAFALVLAPDGKRYIVRRGDIIGAMGGRIIRIEPKSIIVREVNVQDGKAVSSNDTELRLPADKLQ
jgi:type IV pilus assembly protein PilP